MSKIEVVKSYRVGNELFNSKEEAERYLVEQEKLSLLNNLTYKESEFHDTSIMNIIFIKVENMSIVFV